MRCRHLLLFAFATLLAAPAFAAPPKACDLLSTADAAKLWGGPVSAGVDRGKNGLMCQFDREHDEWVLVMVIDASSWGANSKKLFDMMAKGTPDQGSEAIPNLGEGAYFNKSSAASNDNALRFLHHGAFITLTVRYSKDPHIKDDLIQVAKQMIAKF